MGSASPDFKTSTDELLSPAAHVDRASGAQRADGAVESPLTPSCRTIYFLDAWSLASRIWQLLMHLQPADRELTMVKTAVSPFSFASAFLEHLGCNVF
jgi:hypothetical protein